MENLSDLERRLAKLEAAVKDLEVCNQGNVTALMRMQAEASAAHSVLAEVTRTHGFPAEVVQRHLRVRADFFLDRLLVAAERANPRLGAALDDRLLEEVPSAERYPALFPMEDEEEDEERDGGER